MILSISIFINKLLNRYKPITVELDTKLKAFIPDYIPAVGEVDAFIKPIRPDTQIETLGLLIIVRFIIIIIRKYLYCYKNRMNHV